MIDLNDNNAIFPRQSYNRAEIIEKTIREIRIEYKTTEAQIKSSGISYAIVDTDSLIRSKCRKNGVKYSVVKEIAGWKRSTKILTNERT